MGAGVLSKKSYVSPSVGSVQAVVWRVVSCNHNVTLSDHSDQYPPKLAQTFGFFNTLLAEGL